MRNFIVKDFRTEQAGVPNTRKDAAGPRHRHEAANPEQAAARASLCSHSRSLACLAGNRSQQSGQGLDAGEVEPEMPEFIVLAEDDLAVAPRHCVPEHIAVTAPFQE